MLRLIDSRWVYPGGGQYAGLFKDIDVTTGAGALLPRVPEWIARGRTVLAENEPERMPGGHCNKPYECGFFTHCSAWAAMQSPLPPPEYPVALLLRRNMATLTADEKRELKSGRFADVRELPSDFPADERSRALVRSFTDRSAWVSDQLAALVAAIRYPRYHFDFETIAFAIPRWAGTRPYQQVPFQWSCHVEHANGRIEHHEFLDISGDDPRPACAARVVDLIGRADTGAVVVYSQQFEESRLSELARDFPSHAAALRQVIARLVDLLPMFREHYFHPELGASWSIKRVVSALAPDLRYENLDEVRNGGDAQQAYLEVIGTSDPARRAQLRSRLLAYCRRDTEAMVRLVAFDGTPAAEASRIL